MPSLNLAIDSLSLFFFLSPFLSDRKFYFTCAHLSKLSNMKNISFSFFIQSPELIACVKKLKAKQEKVEYERMVSNIDRKVVHDPKTFLLEGKDLSRNIILLSFLPWKSLYHISSNKHLSAYSKFWIKGRALTGKRVLNRGVGGLLLFWADSALDEA